MPTPDPHLIDKTAAAELLFPALRPALDPLPTWRDEFGDPDAADLADGELLHYVTPEGALPHATAIICGGDLPGVPTGTRVENDVTCGTCRAYIARETARLADIREPRGGWPCDRRDAHRAHFDQVEVWELGDVHPVMVDGPACPGVKAHPSTMIGRP
jgi:hypothetical protein